jgi:hypothetical protein
MDPASLEKARSHLGKGRLRSKREKGSLVELADSSHWEVSPGHEIFTDHWIADTEVTVVPGDQSGYPFDLINLRSGERVPAKYLGYSDPELGWSLVDE